MSAFAAVEWSQGIENAWTDIASFVPKLFGFLAVLVIGYFVAKALSKIVDKVLERVGFDRAVERGGIRKMLSKSQYDASDLLAKLVYYGVMLFVLQMAFGVFGANPVSALIASVIAFLPKVFAAVVIVVVASAISAAVREIVSASLGGLSYGKALANAAGVVILGVGLFAALNQLQIAQPIVNGLFYALVGTAAGIAVIAVGGGGVRPMQQYWERTLSRVAEEGPNMRREMANAGERVKERAQQRKEQVEEIDVREPQTEQMATSQPEAGWSVGGSVPGSGTTRNPQGF